MAALSNFFKATFFKIFTIVFSLTCLISCSQTGSNPSAPQNLRCEYQSNPPGIDVLKPRLSWQVSDSRRGAIQSAYQILVASSEQLLQKNQGDIWDTGMVHSDQSVHVPYDGPALESRKRYYWKVRTWDRDSTESPFSKVAWWETGLLQPDDWQAQWIGKAMQKQESAPERWPWGYWIWHPHQVGIDMPVFFRKIFEIPPGKNVKTALVRTTADNYFSAMINDTDIGSGSAWTKVYEFDVGLQLRQGKNIIAVTAANNLGDVCGLLFSLKITFDDDNFLVINSDDSWKTADTKMSGWNQLTFSDRNWDKVRVIEPYGGSQWGKIDAKDVYTPPRSILLRKQFTAGKTIRQARVYVTGLGSYVMQLNGHRVGNDVLTPGWTHYPERIQYQMYDVTSLLKKGENAVGAVLGNAWWSGGLGWRGAYVYSEGPLRFLMQLLIDYTDGAHEIIVTDQSWKTHDAPILENSIYHGETYDARLELPEWDTPGFDDSKWHDVIVLESEKARLVAQQGPTIQVTQEIVPVQITEPDSGVFVFDLGQNMVGTARLKVTGATGSKVVMRFAEVLQEDGTIYTDNLRSARATDCYILAGNGVEIWQPYFTYHGFRYVEVSGYPGTPTRDAITGSVFHSAAPVIGHFACSNDLINKIQKNITWGQRGNMHSVPTDCPQRDERLGWMGDAQIFAPTACYNMNMAGFFGKWMHDIIDCQDEVGYVHDVNPAIAVSGPASPGWGDAVVVIPWMVYQFYGDKRIIEENYQGMVAWVHYMKNMSKDLLYERSGYGDWIAVIESPKAPIGAAYFYYSTQLLAQMAAIIGKDADARQYTELSDKIALAFNEKYLDKNTNQYQGTTQTANLLPVAFAITPEASRHKVVENVVKDIQQRDNHLSTGFLGTAYILPILSQYGYHDLAYQLACQKSYPSWGYMVAKDATTIWELWNSDTQGPGMNSRNHFALGAVGQWFYGYLAGLQPDPQYPGFKRAIIAPKPVGDLILAEASLETAYGTIKTHWHRDDKSLNLNISIPANATALVHLPTATKEQSTILEGNQVLLKNGTPVTNMPGITFVQWQDKVAVLEVGAGTYRFTVLN